jgi:hypothetical protein
MMMSYKQLCCRCRKKYVVVTWKDKYPWCYDCQKSDMQGEIKDKKIKKLFDIPEELYMESRFLRNIKINYLRYGRLSDAQVSAFKKVVKEIKAEKGRGK